MTRRTREEKYEKANSLLGRMITYVTDPNFTSDSADFHLWMLLGILTFIHWQGVVFMEKSTSHCEPTMYYEHYNYSVSFNESSLKR